LLAALLGGIGMYAATGNKQASFAVGAGLALLALLVLYQQGKAEREQIEQELSRLPESEQDFWRPIIDNPALLEEKLKELQAA